MFHRRFTHRRIKKQVMTKVMKRAGLRKKKVTVRNVPHNAIQRQTEFAQTTLNLDQKIFDILKADGHLVFIDECVFKSRDFKRTAWSRPHENLAVEDCVQNQPC